MKKFKFFIISIASSILISSTVSATLMDNSKKNFNILTTNSHKFGFIVYNTATLNADVRGNVYAKNITNVNMLSGTSDKPLYYSCENQQQPVSNVHYCEFNNEKLQKNKMQIENEIEKILKTKTVLKYNDLISNDKLVVTQAEGKMIFIEIPKEIHYINACHLNINGSQPNDFSNLYKNIILIYQGKGELNINVDCIGGTLLAPNADVVLSSACGNFDGAIFANNLTTECEIHQVLPNIPATIKNPPETDSSIPETSSSEVTPPEESSTTVVTEESSTTVVTEESSNVDLDSEQPGKGGGDDNYADTEIDEALNKLDSSSIASDQSSTTPYQFSAKIVSTKQPIPGTTNPYTGNFLKTFIPTFLIVLIGITFILKKVINKNNLQ